MKRHLIISMAVSLLVSACGGDTTADVTSTTAAAQCVPAPDAVCRGARLAGVDLTGKSLVGIDLRGADLSGAKLAGADLTQAVLIGAKLTGAVLDGAILARATAKNADFSEATVHGTRFTNAVLAGAKFDGVDTSTAYATAAVSEGATPVDVVGRFLDDDVTAAGSNSVAAPVVATAADVAPLLEEMTYRISRDRIAPTKAARRYAYVALAQFAASAPEGDPLLGSVADFALPGARPASVDPTIAGIVAASVVARSLFVINADKTTIAEVSDGILASIAADATAEQLADSFAWGRSVAGAIVDRSKRDGFTESLKMTVTDTKGPGVWVPTPPNFQPAIDPGWGTVASFFTASTECSLPAPQRGANVESPFDEQAAEVAKVASQLTDEQKSIARFWDDGRGRTGTPAGHWMVIGLEAAKSKNLSATATFRLLAHEMMTLSDAFVGIWREKYKWMVERPITVLQRSDPKWSSYLMTPAFPEYPSGHSGVSRAAADVLTAYLGQVAFDDPGYGVTEQSRRQFSVTPRSFASFDAAATEASQSRLFAGIHYPIGLSGGQDLGACIARRVLDKTLVK